MIHIFHTYNIFYTYDDISVVNSVSLYKGNVLFPLKCTGSNFFASLAQWQKLLAINA